MSNKGASAIVARPEECRRCLICQLVCSLAYDGAANPAKARIRIGRTVKRGDGFYTMISFTEDCNGCGLCTRHCAYGALSRATADAESVSKEPA